MMSKAFTLALSGELNDYLENADRHVLIAARYALDETAEGVKDRMSGMVERAGLGKLRKTVSYRIYPEQGLSRTPSALVYVQPRAVPMFESFEEGATIQARMGGKLIIPIPDSPADRDHFGRDPSRKKGSKLDWYKQKGIEIKFVPGSATRPAMLVADSVRLRNRGKTGRVAISRAKRLKSGGYAKRAVMVPLFWVVDSARMPKRLNWKGEEARSLSNFMSSFSRAFARRLNEMSK